MTTTIRDHRAMSAALVVMGMAWGLSWPLAKIAVSGGYEAFGLIFWQLVITAIFFGAVNLIRNGRWPVDRRSLLIYAIVATFGTVIPDAITYPAVYHLPAGILSIVVATMPMLAFPIALMLGADKFSPWRLTGLALGLAGVALIALPDSDLHAEALVFWLLFALIAPLSYAVEGNIIGKWGTSDLDPLQVLLGAAILGLLVITPLTLMTGQFIDPRPPYAAPDAALVGNSLLHTLTYMGYVWMVGRAGAVFAAQVSYLVTGFGVIWSMVLLGERYSLWIWAALALMLAGIGLVQPRRSNPLAPLSATGENGLPDHSEPT
jgi:drug/metabolite transporter (DMT)-like permease